MGGSHREAAEAVVLGRNLAGKGGGSLVAGAGEADAWAVEKWGRSWSSGVAERRKVKGGRPAADVCVERNRLSGAGQRGKKGGRRGRVRVEAREGGRGGPAQRLVARGGRQRPPIDGHRGWRCFVNRGGWRGASDEARAWLTGGARRQWGPMVSGGVWERVRESGVARRGALPGGFGSTVTAGSVLNSILN
jgi:hypothetical protein